MDVVLGVAVAGPIARLALVGAAAEASSVIDQSSVDLADDAVLVLTETVVGTNRLLVDEGHRLVATRLCWSDQGKADELRDALDSSGVQDVAVLSESEAATALLGVRGSDSAVLLVGEETASLSIPGAGDAPPTLLAATPVEGDATSTFDTLMARFDDQAGTPDEVLLVGTSDEQTSVIADQLRGASTMRVQIPEDPTFALARGAAMAAVAAGSTMAQPAVAADATTYLAPAAVVDSNRDEDGQLAYSQAADDELLPADGLDDYDGYPDDYDEYGDYDDEAGAAARPRLSSRSLLISNAVVAFAVIGFASLAVAVAVAIRPTAAAQPVEGHQNAQPGKFMPLLPTQQQAPVPPPPADEPTAGFQGGTIPAVQGVVPRQGTSPGTGGPPVAPAPAPAPGVVPAPIPLPVPIIIPWPGWSPGVPTPPTAPPTTTVTTPPTTTKPPTTTVTTPPTTTPVTTPPTTTKPSTTTVTTAPTTPVTTAPTTPKPTTVTPTTVAPTTVAPTTVVPTTVAPTTVVPTTVAPTTVAPQPTQQTIAPQPTQQPTQQTIAPQPTQQAPQPPSGGGSSGGGSSGGGSSGGGSSGGGSSGGGSSGGGSSGGGSSGGGSSGGGSSGGGSSGGGSSGGGSSGGGSSSGGSSGGGGHSSGGGGH
ncbi:hypothetical protein MB901379_00753 [Mycobacterium basiliense]|uniref:DUF7159 domain-containing protein n=1 Tax=Mycobacterium basiliense TaxID=2094119 RepID=A0A3S4BFP4_9MYCO|nr:hypothetical protein [Mycobacterium basiliense]VDM87218.1 hypothetical protein MB901379_00753 [Mycobacterium basiliense]